jgi:hypothetical protein
MDIYEYNSTKKKKKKKTISNSPFSLKKSKSTTGNNDMR